uniref:Uncharacterized protein n=1 Tax=Rhizophora mucronata TaxID=61149 RepID=A0A2P2NES8_RHIMU
MGKLYTQRTDRRRKEKLLVKQNC